MWRSQIMRSELLSQHNKYAWVVAWPLILFTALASCTQSQGATASDTSEGDAVGRFGQKAITAYVSASPVDTGAVEAIYGPLVAPPGDDAGFAFPAEKVLGVIAGTPKLLVTRTDKTRVWSVSADVVTGSGEQRWQQYIAVTASGGYRVEGLPGVIPSDPTALPETADQQGHGLTKIDAGSAIYSTVADFFDAWLTGKGDLPRVASDSVPAFPKPPYNTVSIDSVCACREPENPNGSLTATVSVIARKVASEKMAYNLTLTAIGGRWVVTDVSAVPASG